MKNQSPELPPVTYKEAIKLLNGLCEGLGDAIEDNRINACGQRNEWSETKYRVGKFIDGSFYWSESPEGHKRWNEISQLLLEIESGAGIKQ